MHVYYLKFYTDIHKEALKYTLKGLTESKINIDEKDVLHRDKDKKLINDIRMLIMVVDTSEYCAAMRYFTKSTCKVKKLMGRDGTCYYVGVWDKIPAALVRLVDHHTSKANNTTKSSIALFPNLKAIIALGVCGTTKEVAYVLVSSEIYRYCQPKECTDKIFDPSDITEPGSCILKCLKDNYEQWFFVCTEKGYESKTKFTPMLSGTKYIASGKYEDKLIEDVDEKEFGVEMEGIGVITAIKEENQKIDFVIVKGGCNYADENKHKEWQPISAMAAAKFLYHQLNKPGNEYLFNH